MPEVFTKENRKKHSNLSKAGTKNGRAKLTEEDVLTIRKKWDEGVTRKELYALYPQVSQVSIRDIINKKNLETFTLKYVCIDYPWLDGE